MDIRRFSMYQGAMLGSALVFCGLLFHLFDILTCESPFVSLFINTFLMIVILSYSLNMYKSLYNDGVMNFSLCVKVGISISVFSAFLFGMWKVLLVYFINPEFSSLCVDYEQQEILKFDEKFPGLFDVDPRLDQLEKARTPASSHMIFFREIINKAFGGFILSSLIYFFIRDKFSNSNI